MLKPLFVPSKTKKIYPIFIKCTIKKKSVVFNDSSTSQKHWAMCTSPSSYNSPETSGSRKPAAWHVGEHCCPILVQLLIIPDSSLFFMMNQMLSVGKRSGLRVSMIMKWIVIIRKPSAPSKKIKVCSLHSKGKCDRWAKCVTYQWNSGRCDDSCWSLSTRPSVHSLLLGTNVYSFM